MKGQSIMVVSTTAHSDRIKSELREVGISTLALLRFTARYLPKVIHENEHIEAAVFGRHKESEGVFGYIEGILVATDQRIIYVDHKPGFTTMDEIAYDIVSGVRESSSGIHSSLTLFTKMGNYTVSFAKKANAKKFVDYIEMRRIDELHPQSHISPSPPVLLSGHETLRFLQTHEIAVLSTIDRAGNLSGAAVYYFLEGSYIYIITKEGTKKSRNILANPQIALTIYDSDNLQTVQMQGHAEAETDPAIKEFVYQQLIKPRHYNRGDNLPPVTTIQNGGFIVFRIAPMEFSFSDFNKK